VAQFKCYSCNKDLCGHPKIDVDGTICCYFCAKEIVGIKDHPAEEQRKNYLKSCEIQLEKRFDWSERLELSMPSKTTRAIIIISVSGGCALFLNNPIFFLPGLFVGLFVCNSYVEGKRRNWIRDNPEPADPPNPSIKYLRDRIRFFDAGDGKLFQSNYREKILARDNYRCQWCGEVYSAGELEVHHVIPQADGGENFNTNLVTLCYHCHVAENWFGHKHKMR
jgi:hypothetical protein